MTDADRARHAAAFLAHLQRLTEREVAALMDRHAGPQLEQVLAEHTASIISELAQTLPEDTRTGIINEVGSFMLLGYLVRAAEEDAPLSTRAHA